MSSDESNDQNPGPQNVRRGLRGLLRKDGVAHKQDAVQSGDVPLDDFERRLRQARFPIRNKAALVAALGGPGTKLTIRAATTMLSEEIADLCFAESDVLQSPEDAVAALTRSSWARATMKALHMTWLPIRGPDRVSRLVGHIRVQGVPVKALAPSLDYPIASTAELVEKLARARQAYRG